MPDSGRIFLLRLRYELHGQQCENGYWFAAAATCGTGWTDAQEELTQLILQFKNTVYLKIKNFSSNQVHFIQIDGATKKPAEGPISTYLLSPATGDQTFESLPGFNAAVLTLRDGFGGRRHRGRSYYAGIPEEQTEGGILQPDAYNALIDIGIELMTRFGPFATLPCWRYQLFHPTTHNAGAAVQDSISNIVEIDPRREVRSQRHRMLGHGA